MRTKVIFLIILIGIFLSFMNAGKFFDISQKPKAVDIMVSLGGDNGLRIKKTLELYKNNLSKSGKIILTGVDDFDPAMKLYELDWRASYLMKKGIKKENIVFNAKAKNTLEEIFFIKHYMLKHNLHSVMFVTDAPHSRRIGYFASSIAHYADSNLSYIVVATKNNWWDRDSYYTNPDAIIFVLNEAIKLSYYSLLNSIGKLHEK